MVRVLPFRGVAVLLLAASSVVGQTSEPPAELPLDTGSPNSPDFLRQFSSEKNHPLLTLMVDGQLTSFEDSPAPESSRLQPKPQTPAAPSASPATEEACPVEEAIECPTVPMFLPYAYPQQCQRHKCHRRQRHSHCGGYGPNYGNPYLNWPYSMNGCFSCYGAPITFQPQNCGHRWFHKHSCGNNGPAYPGCGYPYGGGYGGGYGGMGGYGFMDADFCGGCMPYMAPPPPPQCQCRRCQRKHGHGQQGGYGFPYGGGYGMMDCDSFCGGCAAFAPPPPQSHCRRCQRKHGSRGYGYEGCGYPGWPAYPVPGANMGDYGYNAYEYPGDCGGGRHHRCGLFHRCHHPQTPPYPYWAYPQTMPCMTMEPFGDDCIFEEGTSATPAASGKSK